ncbi:MAG: CPBP family intramembrane metalloprotease [Muribaculum sp.]|uniref:CPBP family intramembrane metalloprotease n=1 Tax=Candidatus Merdivivens faecigallinarum TaxID=2840871 RepID=A0A9D9NPV1_9BACT|nr:CPBP family intramembrane metalloprotease [Candidatus Merdivivens faecigallinarum]
MFKKLSYYLPGLGQSWILVLLLLAGNLVSSAVTFALSALFTPIIPPEQFINDYFSPVAYLIMMLFPILYAINMGKKSMLKNSIHSSRNIPIDNNSFGKAGWVLSALLVALMIVCSSMVIDPINSIMPEPWDWVKQSLDALINGPKATAIISVAILAPLLEELLCRGIILRGLLKHTSVFMAIFWSSLIFAVIHLNPFQAIPAFLIGILMGWVYYKTGSLKLTILMHFTNNFLSLLISWNFPMLSTSDTFRNLIPGNVYWLVIGGCALVLVLCIIALANSWKGMSVIKRR